MRQPSPCLIETARSAPGASSRFASCDVAVGALPWLPVCFDGGRCHGWFACCFDPGCRSLASSCRYSWLGWRRYGVQKELKDMDLCQCISYIAHILQVQLRIGDRRPWPCSAHPTICAPGAGGYKIGLRIPRRDSLPSINPSDARILCCSPQHH